MTFVMLAMIFLSISILVSCNKLPLVTLNQLDTVHGVANPFKITKYNEDTCELEIVGQPPFPILGEQLHGGVCLTKEDFSAMKAKIQADCRNNHQQ